MTGIDQPSTLPTLRPTARFKAYYDELRAINAAVGDALETEARAHKDGKTFTLECALSLALRYRLKMAALFTLLEDRRVLPFGTYDRIKDRRVQQDDGSYRTFAPMHELASFVARNGLPDAAPGCEE